MDTSLVTTEAVLTRADVLMLGFTPWRLRRAVAEGQLVRLRRDRYVRSTGAAIDTAVQIGGRLTCVSLLAMLGVFVRSIDIVHVQVPPNASRQRRPAGSSALRMHWGRLSLPAPSRHAVAIADAVSCAIRCLAPRDAIATLDSVLYLGVLTWDEVAAVVRGLPARYLVLLPLVDGRAESGIESIVRLMLRQLGADVDVQVKIPSVGRVDLVVDGWLIIECDSKQFHEGWEQQRADRRRDIAAARLGYSTIRPLAEDVLYHPERVFEDLRAILAHGPRAPR